jgi:hypothetical protein
MGAPRKVYSSWIARSVLAAAIVAAATAVLSLGSSSALAGGSKSVSASTLLTHACSDTLAASAFDVQGQVKGGGSGPLSINLHFGSAGNVMTLTENGDETVNIITNGTSAYMKGNHAFWQTEVSARDSGVASLLAGRWIDVTSDKKDFSSLSKQLSKKNLLSQCGGGGSASYVGHATINGIKVTKVHELANQESDTYYVEGGSTSYILRVTGSASQKKSGDLVLSDYGLQPDTSEPPGTIPISSLG